MKVCIEAGKQEEYVCPHCKSVCDVERGIVKPTPTGFASAMASSGLPKVYDQFKCPNNCADWHMQIEKIAEQMEKIASHSIRKIMQGDIDELNRTHECVIDVMHWWW